MREEARLHLAGAAQFLGLLLQLGVQRHHPAVGVFQLAVQAVGLGLKSGGETFGLSTRLGEHAGLRRIGVNVHVVRPGERSTKYHWHHEEEECFLVLSGTGILMVGDDLHRVGPGDFLAKREGPDRAHQFVNDGEQDLRILTIGEHRGDKVEYPTAPWQGGDPFPQV